jgi:hypothetical protein
MEERRGWEREDRMRGRETEDGKKETIEVEDGRGGENQIRRRK